VGTAVAVAPVSRIGYEPWKGKEIVLPAYEGGGLGPVGRALYATLNDIQMGKLEFEGWSVKLE